MPDKARGLLVSKTAGNSMRDVEAHCTTRLRVTAFGCPIWSRFLLLVLRSLIYRIPRDCKKLRSSSSMAFE